MVAVEFFPVATALRRLSAVLQECAEHFWDRRLLSHCNQWAELSEVEVSDYVVVESRHESQHVVMEARQLCASTTLRTKAPIYVQQQPKRCLKYHCTFRRI
jgi:hypothetical protein